LSQTVAPGLPAESNAVFVGDLESKTGKILLPATNSNVAYAPPGFLLFWRERTLLAQPFDAKELRLTGEATPVAEDVQYLANSANAIFSVSENGVLAFQAGAGAALSQLTWFDRRGKKLGSVGAPADYGRLRLSHDGLRLAVDVTDPRTGSSNVWIHDLVRRTATRFTFEAVNDHSPVWSPDDDRIFFTSSRKGAGDIYQKSTAGTGADELLLASPAFKPIADCMRDGRFLAFHTVDPTTKTRFDLWVFSVADRKASPFLQSEFNETHAAFSPDARWIAYASDETGRNEIYVQAFPGAGGKWQVSTAGGSQPRWRGDGKELFYVASGKMMAVPVQAGGTFQAGDPAPLFDVRLKTIPGVRYDVSADGQRFLANVPAGEESATPITLTVNWTAGLQK
ncbi:MAG: hypothetical protein ACRD1Z_17975, partial [Vicinamibacteria bacterium]